MTTIGSQHRLVTLSAIVMLAGVGLAQDSYRTSIDTWRAEREKTIKGEEGWLSVSGLFWLKEGANRFGAGVDNEIVLPLESGVARAGIFLLDKGKIELQVEDGVVVSLAGKPVRRAEVKTDAAGPPDVLRIGDLSLTVIKRGKRYGVRLKDKLSRNRKYFTGLKWFPVKESFRVPARFIAYEQPKEIDIVNVLGDVEKSKSPGVLSFTLLGRTHRLEPIIDEGKLFIIFKDLTSGKTTYPAGRFLYAEMPKADAKQGPKDSVVILDFNQAINPPCAFTDFATCPLPPRQNRLNIAIEAGEKTYHLGTTSRASKPMKRTLSRKRKTRKELNMSDEERIVQNTEEDQEWADLLSPTRRQLIVNAGLAAAGIVGGSVLASGQDATSAGLSFKPIVPPPDVGKSPWGYETYKEATSRPLSLRPGEERALPKKPRPYTDIKSYHAHFYFDEDTYEKAALVRKWSVERFPVELGNWNLEPRGPHVTPSFYFGFTNDLLPIVVPWLQLNSLGLTILLHPNTDDPRADHLYYTLWVNRSQPVNAYGMRKPQEGTASVEKIFPNTRPTVKLET